MQIRHYWHDLIWDSDLKGLHKLVAFAIIDFADHEGNCQLSINDLAARTGTSRDTIKRALRVLKEQKIIRIDTHIGTQSVYRLNTDPPALTAPPPSADSTTPQRSQHHPSALTAPPLSADSTTPQRSQHHPSALTAPPPSAHSTTPENSHLIEKNIKRSEAERTHVAPTHVRGGAHEAAASPDWDDHHVDQRPPKEDPIEPAPSQNLLPPPSLDDDQVFTDVPNYPALLYDEAEVKAFTQEDLEGDDEKFRSWIYHSKLPLTEFEQQHFDDIKEMIVELAKGGATGSDPQHIVTLWRRTITPKGGSGWGDPPKGPTVRKTILRYIRRWPWTWLVAAFYIAGVKGQVRRIEGLESYMDNWARTNLNKHFGAPEPSASKIRTYATPHRPSSQRS